MNEFHRHLRSPLWRRKYDVVKFIIQATDLPIDYELRQSWFNRRCNNVDNDDDDDDGDEWQARK